MRTLRAALKTVEGLPGELAGRVSASGGRFSFKTMLQAAGTAEERPASRPHSSPSRAPKGERQGTRGPMEAVAAQLSAAQKAALTAVTMLGGGGGNVAAGRTPHQ